MRAVFTASVLFSVLSVVHSSPLAARDSITKLNSVNVAAFKPYTWFAKSAYCSPSSTLAWTCGESCDANPDFIPVASGGDGGSVQYWYVGYAPSLSTVIVGHQGTDMFKLESDLTDLNVSFTKLNSTLFPNIDSYVEVHEGFADAHAQTATAVLAAVKQAISAHGATKVTIVGHSLGAAIALLDGMYLPLHLDGVTFQTIGYGTPRVGNHDFVEYIDANVPFTHINNREDPIAIVPGRLMGFRHPSGEIHIQDSGDWLACPGQDNIDDRCIVGDVSNIFEGNILDHVGPYDGVYMGC